MRGTKRRERENVTIRFDITPKGLRELPARLDNQSLILSWRRGSRKTGSRGQLPPVVVSKRCVAWPPFGGSVASAGTGNTGDSTTTSPTLPANQLQLQHLQLPSDPKMNSFLAQGQGSVNSTTSNVRVSTFLEVSTTSTVTATPRVLITDYGTSGETLRHGGGVGEGGEMVGELAETSSSTTTTPSSSLTASEATCLVNDVETERQKKRRESEERDKEKEKEKEEEREKAKLKRIESEKAKEQQCLPTLSFTAVLVRKREKNKFKAAKKLKFICSQVLKPNKAKVLLRTALRLEQFAEDGTQSTTRLPLLSRKKKYTFTRPYLDVAISATWLKVNGKLFERQGSCSKFEIYHDGISGEEETVNELSVGERDNPDILHRSGMAVALEQADDIATLQKRMTKLEKRESKQRKLLEKAKDKQRKKEEKLEDVLMELEEKRHEVVMQGCKIETLKLDMMELKKQLSDKDTMLFEERSRVERCTRERDRLSAKLEETKSILERFSAWQYPEDDPRAMLKLQLRRAHLNSAAEDVPFEDEPKAATAYSTMVPSEVDATSTQPTCLESQEHQVVDLGGDGQQQCQAAAYTRTQEVEGDSWVEGTICPTCKGAGYLTPLAYESFVERERRGPEWSSRHLLIAVGVVLILLVTVGLYNGGVLGLNDCLLCWGVGFIHCASYFYLSG